jgi:hypothetical protein
MGLPKGKTNNSKGRAKGSKNERTIQWEALGKSIETKHVDRFNKVLSKMDDDTFAKNFLQVLEFFKPKLQRSEVSAKVDNQVTQTYMIGGRTINF